MKLYTEEQVTELTTAAYYAGQNHNTFIFGNKFESITPIELPSDEEIDEVADIVYGFNNSFETNVKEYKAFKYGAKWMRDKIQGGNNEQQ
jgi:hypothetical protein